MKEAFNEAMAFYRKIWEMFNPLGRALFWLPACVMITLIFTMIAALGLPVVIVAESRFGKWVNRAIERMFGAKG